MATYINTDFFYQDTKMVLDYLDTIIESKVPSQGKADERHAELLRCFANLRYECYNNGYGNTWHWTGVDDGHFGAMFRTLEIGLHSNLHLLFPNDEKRRGECRDLLRDIDPRNGGWITEEDEDGFEHEEWQGCSPDVGSFDDLAPYVAVLVAYYERGTEAGEVA